MATITSTIGTNSRNYSTLQAWEDALPASAVTADNSYAAELYKDSEFLSAVNTLTIAGVTTDATHTLTVRAAAGQSFRDHASVRSNALRYSAANGVAIRSTSGYGITIDVQVGFVTFDGLQIAHTNNGRALSSGASTTPPNLTINNCLLEGPGSFSHTVGFIGLNGLMQNTVLVNTGGGQGVSVQAGGLRIYNCTIVKIGAANNTGIAGAAEVRNTVVANFTTCFNGQIAGNCSNNASTDTTAPGTGSLVSLTLASMFEAPDTDYRTKVGAALINAGTTVGLAVDISNTARPQGGAYDIGAWEVAALANVSLLGSESRTGTTANAALATRTVLSSASATPARSAASLSTQVQLAATGMTRAGAAASLIPGVASLSVGATTRGAVVAMMVTQILIGSSGITNLAAVATLATDAAPLSVAPNTAGSASASLSTQALLVAAANTRASLSTSLSTQVTLVANAASRSSAVAALATAQVLSVNPTSRSSAVAALSTQIEFGSTAITRSRGSGELVVGLADSIEIVPASVTVGGQTVTDFDWLADGEVTLSVSLGAIAPDGTYLAPPEAASEQIVTLTVTSVDDPTKRGTATIIIPAAKELPPMASRTVSIILGSGPTTAVVPAANLTGLSVSFHDEPTPGRTTVARYQSDAQTTDVLGRLKFSFLSTLPVGGKGLLTLEHLESGLHFNAPVAVS